MDEQQQVREPQISVAGWLLEIANELEKASVAIPERGDKEEALDHIARATELCICCLSLNGRVVRVDTETP